MARTETWNRQMNEMTTQVEFVVDEGVRYPGETVTVTYELWADMLSALGYTQAEVEHRGT